MSRPWLTIGGLLVILSSAVPAMALAGDDKEDKDKDDKDKDDKDKDDKDKDDEDEDEDEDDEGGDVDGGAIEPGPCSGGSWGKMGEPGDDWVHVSALLGDDVTGDGSIAAPYATVGVAMEAARVLPLGTERTVALWPGAYDANVSWTEGAGWDDPVALVGCSASEVTVQAADPTLPVVDAALVQEAFVGGVTLSGGSAALTGRAGVDLTAKNVVVVASKDAGVRVLDAETVVTLRSVIVSEPVADVGCGFGVEVEDGTLDMRFGGVIGATTAGVYGSFASVTLDEIFVFETNVDGAGRYGRAIHTQDSYTEVTRSYLSGSTDTSIMVLRPTGGGIDRVLIDITQTGIVAGRTTGDSITVVGGLTSLFVVTNNISLDAARAAILIEDSTVGLAGNTEINSGAVALYGSESLGQKRLKLGGADAASVLWLAPGSEVEIDRDSLTCTP